MTHVRSFFLPVLFIAVAGMGLLAGTAPRSHAQDPFPSHSVGLLSTEALSPAVKQAAWSAVRGPQGRKSGGTMGGTVALELAVLHAQYERHGAAGVRALLPDEQTGAPSAKSARRTGPQGRMRSPVSPDGRFVAVEAVASGEPGRLLRALRRHGLENGAVAGNLVSGRLPIGRIRAAAQLPALRGMVPSYLRLRAGSVGSQADTAHGAYRVREDIGLDGSTQKVCGLSDSYDTSSDAATTADEDVASGDLPGRDNPEGNTTPVDVLEDYDGDEPPPSDEGRAMLQLIHDIAPGAELGFHTAAGGLGVFIDGVRALADPDRGNCDVIVDDIGYNIQPFYQDGPLSLVIDSVVAEGTPYFSSAGNDGQNSYEAPFRNSGEPGVISSSSVRHDFDPTAATDTRQRITVADGGVFQIFSFQWSDPSAILQGSAGADTDLDIALVDPNSGDIVTQSGLNSDSLGLPFESLSYRNTSGTEQELDLVIEKAAGPNPDEIKYIYVGLDADVEEYDTLGPTIFGHPNAAGAMSTAAAPFFNTAAYNSNIDSSATLNFFSSKGGIPILFGQDGTRLGTPERRQKPDVTGVDFVNNTFFGSDIDLSDDDFFPNFSGTSAAAPNVAAVAALIQQSEPGFTAEQVYDRLESTAVDVTSRQNRNGDFVDVAEGIDPWSGHGLVDAEAAVPVPDDVRIGQFAASSDPAPSEDGSVRLRWRQIGEQSVDAFVLRQRFFDGPFTEQARLAAEDGPRFERTIENLPVGTHTFRVEAVRNDSVVAVATTRRTIQAEEARVLAYPNPFRNVVNLSVTLRPSADPERVRVTVFDALGRQVGVPVSGRRIEQSQSLSLSAQQMGTRAAGVYFLRIEGDSFTETIQVSHVE
jgi:hypothetical protein